MPDYFVNYLEKLMEKVKKFISTIYFYFMVTKNQPTMQCTMKLLRPPKYYCNHYKAFETDLQQRHTTAALQPSSARQHPAPPSRPQTSHPQPSPTRTKHPAAGTKRHRTLHSLGPSRSKTSGDRQVSCSSLMPRLKELCTS